MQICAYNAFSCRYIVIVRSPYKAKEKEQIHSPKEQIYCPCEQIRSRLCRQYGAREYMKGKCRNIRELLKANEEDDDDIGKQ